MGSSMHDPESVAVEMFFRDLANHDLVGDGGSREDPIGPREDGAELTDTQWELIGDLATDYKRKLLVVSGTSLYEVVPQDANGEAVTPAEIEKNMRSRAAPNN